MPFTIPNKIMNWNIPDPITLDDNCAKTMSKLLFFFNELSTNEYKEWQKIIMCQIQIEMVSQKLNNVTNSFKTYTLPEMLFTTGGLTLAQYKNTFKYTYNMKQPYEPELLERLLYAMQMLIFKQRNLNVHFMKYFNEQYKKYQENKNARNRKITYVR